MHYEILVSEASDTGLTVKEKPLKYNNGRIKGNKIAIRKDLETSSQKTCVLAEELGHHYTTVGNILDQADTGNRKQERRARLWAYDKLIGLHGIIEAFEHGCRNRYEIAEYLDVTESFLLDAIAVYREKYGVCKKLGNYIIYFEPALTIGKLNG